MPLLYSDCFGGLHGSYDLTNPQSFNRYAYAENDPVNLVDPLGLDPEIVGGILGNSLAAFVGPFATVTVDGGNGDGGEMVEPIRPDRPLMAHALNPQNPGRQIVPLGNLQKG